GERRGRVIHAGIHFGSTGNRRNSRVSTGRRQPSTGGTSRISRETYVRFCERLGVRFPGSTRRVGEAGSSPPGGIQRGRIGQADDGRWKVASSRVLSAGSVLEYYPENRYFGGNGDLPWPPSHSAPANSRTGSARRSTARSASRC